MSAAIGGSLATEHRILDIDDAGTFWTNGRLGDQVLSICQYGLPNGSGGDLATFQDGPDLCTDPSRSGTQIEILDSQRNVVSRPAVCAAGFGLTNGTAYAGQVRLQLEKDTDDASGIAFTLGINHCLPIGTGFPTVVGPSDILGSTCAEEAVSLEVGAPAGVNKPTAYAVSAGTWTIQNASPDRATAHRSQIDLTLSSTDGVSYSARGVVSLPQLLF